MKLMIELVQNEISKDIILEIFKQFFRFLISHCKGAK